MLQDDVAGQPASVSGVPPTGQALVGEITRCQEAVQQTLMALRTGSTRREVERRAVRGELLDHLATMPRLLPADGLVSGSLEQRIHGYLERLKHLLPSDAKVSLDRETARELPTEVQCMFGGNEVLASYEQMFCIVGYHMVWDSPGCIDVAPAMWASTTTRPRYERSRSRNATGQ